MVIELRDHQGESDRGRGWVEADAQIRLVAGEGHAVPVAEVSLLRHGADRTLWPLGGIPVTDVFVLGAAMTPIFRMPQHATKVLWLCILLGGTSAFFAKVKPF